MIDSILYIKMVSEKEYQFKVESIGEVMIEGRINLFASNRKKALKKFEKSYPNFRVVSFKELGDDIES